MATNILDTLNKALKSTEGMVVALTILGSIAISILATK